MPNLHTIQPPKSILRRYMEHRWPQFVWQEPDETDEMHYTAQPGDPYNSFRDVLSPELVTDYRREAIEWENQDFRCPGYCDGEPHNG